MYIFFLLLLMSSFEICASNNGAQKQTGHQKKLTKYEFFKHVIDDRNKQKIEELLKEEKVARQFYSTVSDVLDNDSLSNLLVHTINCFCRSTLTDSERQEYWDIIGLFIDNNVVLPSNVLQDNAEDGNRFDKLRSQLKLVMSSPKDSVHFFIFQKAFRLANSKALLFLINDTNFAFSEIFKNTTTSGVITPAFIGFVLNELTPRVFKDKESQEGLRTLHWLHFMNIAIKQQDMQSFTKLMEERTTEIPAKNHLNHVILRWDSNNVKRGVEELVKIGAPIDEKCYEQIKRRAWLMEDVDPNELCDIVSKQPLGTTLRQKQEHENMIFATTTVGAAAFLGILLYFGLKKSKQSEEQKTMKST